MTAELQRFKELIGKAATGARLSEDEAGEAFALMMTGNATPAQIAGLLMALRVRGETVEEITAGARSLRERMVTLAAPEGAIDTCGTGGDGVGTYNISTAAAIVVAGAGVPVAKHGNRGLSSKSGSAEVLAAARRQHRRRVRAGRAGDARGRDRLHDGAAPSWRHAPRRRPARRARHPHHLQSAGAAGQPGRGQAAADGRVRRASGSSRWPRCWAAWARELRLGGAWQRRARRADHHRHHPVAEWDGSRVRRFEVTPEDAGLPAPASTISRAAIPPTMPRPSAACWRAEPGRCATRSSWVPPAPWSLPAGPRPCWTAAGLAARSIDSGAAQAALEKLVRDHQRPGRGMSDVLARICAVKREHVARAQGGAAPGRACAPMLPAEPPRGFARALAETAADGRLALIAEIKKASPSSGLIRADFDPPALARAYAAGGAACLSVLTDDALSSRARTPTSPPPAPPCRCRPCARTSCSTPGRSSKSRVLGADCVLLIMACLDDATARELAAAAAELGMDVLVEVHDEAELDRALALPGTLLGVNNRNLKTLAVDLATFERLAPRAPADRLLVAESGLYAHADLLRMAAAGARAFLVGESLMREADVDRRHPPAAWPLAA